MQHLIQLVRRKWVIDLIDQAQKLTADIDKSLAAPKPLLPQKQWQTWLVNYSALKDQASTSDLFLEGSGLRLLF
jgi:hypothetical protein